MSALDIGITMACACATIQQLLGVSGEDAPATAALALTIADDAGSFDYLDDGDPGDGVAANGSTITLTPPLLIVGDAGTDGIPMDAPHAELYAGTVSILLIIAEPAAAAYSGSTVTRYLRTKQLAIRDELVAQIGGIGAFASATVSTIRPYRSEAKRAPFKGSWRFQLDIVWE